MSILSKLFGNSDLHRYYSEIDSLKRIRKEFENYVFNVYEKVRIICEIMNKCHDIEYQHKGYIWEDEKIFGRDSIPNGNKNYRKDRKVFYYKGWVNRRLKSIIRMLENSGRRRMNVSSEEHNLSRIISELKTHFGDSEFRGDLDAARHVVSLLERLDKNISRQIRFLAGIYPMKDWSIEAHSKLISEEMIGLIREEISILFESRISSGNYNEFQAIISRAIHEHRIPADSILRRLIDERIEKVNQKRREGAFETLILYHGRPMTVTGDIFPLGVEKRKVGLFIDSDYDETVKIVKSLYNLPSYEEVTVFELTIPKNLMKHCISDTFDERMLKIGHMDHSYIVRPTSFPVFNEFYRKGLIRVRRIS